MTTRYLIEEITNGETSHSIAMDEKAKDEIVMLILSGYPDKLKVYMLNEDSLSEEHNK